MPTHGALSKAGKVRALAGSRKDRSKPRPNPRVKTRGNITTVSFYKGDLVNMNLADVGIEVDEEDDGWSVQVS